jgi:hypothetical protein
LFFNEVASSDSLFFNKVTSSDSLFFNEVTSSDSLFFNEVTSSDFNNTPRMGLQELSFSLYFYFVNRAPAKVLYRKINKPKREDIKVGLAPIPIMSFTE